MTKIQMTETLGHGNVILFIESLKFFKIFLLLLKFHIMFRAREGIMEFKLEERTYLFAKTVRQLIKQLPKTIGNLEDSRQLVRSSGSIGANYIEANEALSKKDFILRIKIARKEAKETGYWLKLLDTEASLNLEVQRDKLLKESNELRSILSAILRKSENGK